MYPIKVKSTPSFIDQFSACEEGRYEDALGARADGDHERYPEQVAVEILSRHKTIIEMRNEAEVKEIRDCLQYGTVSLYFSSRTIDKLDDRILDVLAGRIPPKPVRKPKVVRPMEKMTEWSWDAVRAAEEHGLIERPGQFMQHFEVLKGRAHHRATGGIRKSKPMVMYGTKYQDDSDLPTHFSEYRSFCTDPEIGSITGTEEEAGRALCCHEVAHAIVLWNERVTAERRPSAAHGGPWRRTYRTLRRHFGLVEQELRAA